jgi:hypothetical protein
MKINKLFFLRAIIQPFMPISFIATSVLNPERALSHTTMNAAHPQKPAPDPSQP